MRNVLPVYCAFEKYFLRVPNESAHCTVAKRNVVLATSHELEKSGRKANSVLVTYYLTDMLLLNNVAPCRSPCNTDPQGPIEKTE